MAGLQSGEGRMMIDSVVWVQYINVTDTRTHRQPRRHSNSHPNALHRAAKKATLFRFEFDFSVLFYFFKYLQFHLYSYRLAKLF